MHIIKIKDIVNKKKLICSQCRANAIQYKCIRTNEIVGGGETKIDQIL